MGFKATESGINSICNGSQSRSFYMLMRSSARAFHLA